MSLDWTQAAWLAVLQGVTEFLPISSSGHLVLVPVVFGWPDQGLAFDVAVHVGSLVAVVAYFRRDLIDLLRAVPDALRGTRTRETCLLLHLALATLPVVVAGALAQGWIEANLRDPLVIAVTMIGFGIVLWVADRYGRRGLALADLTWRGALCIGAAQALALIPGTSRAGITLTAALALGLNRVDAARFSLLLSIPTILAAGVLEGSHLADGDIGVDWPVFAAATLLSAVTAYACIALFLRWIERIGVLPFVIYRVLLGVLLLYLFA